MHIPVNKMKQKVLNTLVFSVAIFLFSSVYSVSSSSDYQTLVVNTLPSSWPKPEPESESLIGESESTNSLSVRLSHVDALTSSFSDATPSELFKLRLRRDSLRVKSLINLAEVAGRKNITRRTPQSSSDAGGLSGTVISGIPLGSGEYFLRLGVGTPATNAYMVIDTGSDVTWLQCAPCKVCYNQSDPIFDPKKSESFSTVGCDSPLCRSLDSPSECVTRGSETCLYNVSYADRSFSVGDFCTETLSFEGARFDQFPLGCGHDNEGMFMGSAGFLGLGRGGLSFPSQTKNRYNGTFSYCLVDRTSPGSSSKPPSTIIFGNDAVPANSVFTPLLTNPKEDTFYYVGLLGISVGGTRLPGVSETLFKLDPASGNGGVIIDSGTSVTRLTQPAYVALRDAFLLGATSLKRARPYDIFDTCFDLSGMTTVNVPTVVFHFDGAEVSLPASNLLAPKFVEEIFCFAFAGTGKNRSLSVIGNIQQQGFRVAYDLVGSRVGFLSGAC